MSESGKSPSRKRYTLEFKKNCAKEAAKFNNNSMVAKKHNLEYPNLDESDIRRWRKALLTIDELKKSQKRKQTRNLKCYYQDMEEKVIQWIKER